MEINGVHIPDSFGMAVGLAVAVVEHVADGCALASPEEIKRRELACNACPSHDAYIDACVSCGCGTIPVFAAFGLDLKRKRSWKSSSCPLTVPRWTAEK